MNEFAVTKPKARDRRGQDESLVTVFERTAATFGARIAVGSDTWQPTYRELNETANRLAHHLIAGGPDPAGRVAILMAHDAPLVAAVWAVLKAGQVIVGLDPGEPLSRLQLLIADAEPSAIVTDALNRDLAAQLAPAGVRIVEFETAAAGWPIGNPALDVAADDLALFAYTSGTTGRPKGVMKTHRQVLSAAESFTEAMQCTADDRVSLLAAISTGQGSILVFWPLLHGAMLCPFPVKTKGVTGLGDWIAARGVTVFITSASIFRALVRTLDDRRAFDTVRLVRLASESVTADDFRLFRRHFPPTSVFVHMLTSTETGIISRYRWTPGDPIPDGVLPVGRLSPNVEVLLVDDDGRPVAPGAVGQIVAGGRSVASGYWRDPALSSRRFSPNLDGRGTRRVWTGDLGRFNADGLLEFRGRADQRIKIRGNRIELAEIEQAVATLPGIDASAAIAVGQERHEPLLVAFVVSAKGASWTAQRLRRALRAILPPHAVPSRIVFLDALPRNHGNKIDRDALRALAAPVPADRPSAAPAGDTEALLAQIWAETLGRPGIGRDDDFFDLGGDSLKGAVVAAQVHAALGIELTLAAIGEHPVLSALAAFIDERREAAGTGLPPIVPAPRAPAIPLSFLQAAMWPRCHGPEFTNVQRARIRGPLDVELLKACWAYLVERHEILRTTFGIVDGRPSQVIHPTGAIDLWHIDLSHHADAERRSGELFLAAAVRALDLSRLPILRHILVKVGPDEHRLATISNFMIIDGYAAATLEDELAMVYEAKLRGRAPPLPPRAALQYADYTRWQRQVADPAAGHLQRMVDWWKRLPPLPPTRTRLPSKRLIRRSLGDPEAGILGWRLAAGTVERLDDVARAAGSTPYIVRLAAFAALVADGTGASTVVLGSAFDNRRRGDAQAIVGRLVQWVPLVLVYDSDKPFGEWVRIVHDRVFATLAHCELPFETIAEQLRLAGAPQPETEITFMLSRDKAEQRFGDLTVRHEPFTVGAMPWGCLVHVDGKNPENCQVRFDAGRHSRGEMQVLMDRYCRLLERAAGDPARPIGALLRLLGRKPLRWTITRWVNAVQDIVKRGRRARTSPTAAG